MKEENKKESMEQRFLTQFKGGVRLLIEDIDVTHEVKEFIRNESSLQKQEIREKIEKMKEEHSKMLCKFPNCGDPVCGHERCIDWMYTDLLENLK